MRTSTVRSTVRSASPDSSERRTRSRLRDLCDEVLASFRVAQGADPFSEQDRTEGRALFGQVVATK